MTVLLSPGISLTKSCFISTNSILYNLSIWLCNLCEIYTMNEKRLWVGTVCVMEGLVGGMYQYDSWVWLILGWRKNEVPSGYLMEEELGGKISLFLHLWEAFSELKDLDNVWVSMSVTPIHTHKSFSTSADTSYSFRANIFATCQS